MKNKITVPAILCGLLASINPTIAMNNNNSLVLSPKHSPYTSPQLSPRNNNNDQLSRSSSGSSPIDIPKQHSPNYFSGASSFSSQPSTPGDQLRRKMSQKALDILKSHVNSEDEKEESILSPAPSCIKIESFSRGKPTDQQTNGKFHIAGITLTDRDNKDTRYQGSVIINDNQAYFTTTGLISIDPLKEEEQLCVQATLTSEQITAVLNNALCGDVIFTIDNFKNPSCITYDEDSAEDDLSFHDDEDSARYEAPFITVLDKDKNEYNCVITYYDIIDGQGNPDKQYIVEIDKKDKNGDFDTLYAKNIPITKDIFQEVLKIDNTQSVVISADHRFYIWNETDLTYVPLSETSSSNQDKDPYTFCPDKEKITFVPLTE